MNLIRTLRTLLLSSVLGAGVFSLSASSWQTPIFHANTPAGYDVLLIEPSGATISFLGLIECPDLEGAQQVSHGTHAKIVNADGKTLVHFPSHFSFRITASLRK